jgi:hypothetical protein
VRRSNYEKFPYVQISPTAEACAVGWDAVGARLRAAIERIGGSAINIAIECYPGVPGGPKMIAGEVFRDALRATARRPFRVVPFFDPAPWGGQWRKHDCDLDRAAPDYGWCFDCVPEENSACCSGSATCRRRCRRSRAHVCLHRRALLADARPVRRDRVARKKDQIDHFDGAAASGSFSRGSDRSRRYMIWLYS